MTDLSMITQSQTTYQQAQTDKALKAADKLKNSPNSFAALTAKQMQDPSHTAAMQKRKIRETAIEFEAQFLSQMLQPMFEGIQAEEPFSGGHSEKLWQSMLVNEYGKSIAKSGGIGLADEVQKQLLRAQEGR
ncbi:rod-binding protein [Terasakiella pusilla]|uniref:rod-binding protein n=1 Tax=Terasakiella pusilla TaxID=64973 RepID=UPI003AA95FB5